MKRRILSLLLALCMMLSLLPATALAAEDTAEIIPPARTEEAAATLTVGTRVSGRQVNPLYSGDEESLRGYVAAPQFYSGTSALSTDGFLTDDLAVLEAIATGMEQREASIVVPWRISEADASTEDELLNFILTAFALALSHNGVPTQGDSLLFGYRTLEYGGQLMAQENGYYYINAIYNLTYYTTAEQEAQLTAKLEQVMASFGFTDETDDYTKIKTIYDYICTNVAYDEEHMNDADYGLMFSAYAALIDGKAVCQGYATLLYRMLLMAGVDNRVIAGLDSETEIRHAWNIVQLNNFYYNLDSTWDAGYSEYEYFLRCPENFLYHTRDEAYDTEEFHTYYPMALADYVPGGNPIFASGTCGEGVNWVLTSDGMLTVSGNGAMDDYTGAPATPWYDYHDYILGVEIQSGVTHVGEYSFDQCSILQVVSVNGAKTIGQRAFSDCPNLIAVDILEGTEEIGAVAFFNSAQLTAISMPASLKSIGADAFSSCYALKAVLLADIAAWCAVSLASESSSPFFLGSASVYLNEESVTDLVIPAGVSSVSNYAFYGASITSLIIPEGVNEIGQFAFSCEQLTSVTLPASLQRIGAYAFADCHVETVTLADVASWCAVAFEDTTATPFHSGASLYVNGEPVSELVIPEGVSAVNDYAFYGANITSLVLPKDLKSVGSYTFYESALTSAVFGDGLLYIGAYAFSESSLKEVWIPASLQTLGPGAFAYVEGMQMHISDVAAWCTMELGNESATGLQTVLCMNGQPITDLKIPEGVVTLNSYAFRHIANEMTVTLPSTLVSIEREAFAYSGIQSIVIPDNVLFIGYTAFGDSAVETVSIGNGVEIIDDYAFNACRNLKSITFGTGLQELGYAAFQNCSSLTSVVFPDNITAIPKYGLSGCSALEVLTLPKNLQTMGDYALQDCTSLTAVAFPDTFTQLGFMTFSGCSALTKVSFAGDAPTFGTRCFYKVTTTAYYPLNNDTWAESVRQNYGGTITWVAACTNHTEVILPAVAATCTQTGLTEGKYCSSCNEVLVKQEIVPVTDHTYAGGICTGCGAADPNFSVTVETAGSITCTVEGNVVTVTHDAACKVGYLMDGAYVKISGTENTDGSYSFEVPEGVTSVLVVVAGDVSGDGKLLAIDKTRLNAALLKKTTLDAKAAFAADVSGDGKLLAIDKTRLNAALLKKTTLTW